MLHPIESQFNPRESRRSIDGDRFGNAALVGHTFARLDSSSQKRFGNDPHLCIFDWTIAVAATRRTYMASARSQLLASL